MRGVMLILEGLADEPWERDPEATPWEAASTPGLDELARSGRIGLAQLGDADLAFDASSGLTAAMGRPTDRDAGWPGGVVEALGAGMTLAHEQPAGRLSLVTIKHEKLSDVRGGGLSDIEGAALYDVLSPMLTGLMNGGGSAELRATGQQRAAITFEGGDLEQIAERFGVPVLEAWRRPLGQVLDPKIDAAYGWMVGIEGFRRAIGRIARRCGEHDVPVLVLLADDRRPPWSDMAAVVEEAGLHAVRTVGAFDDKLARRGLPRSHDAWRATFWLSASDPHPNAVGHEVLARSLLGGLDEVRPPGCGRAASGRSWR